jgi:hypothetical protein
LLTTGLTAFVGIMYSFLQPEIPLFYTLAQPERQLVHKVWIFFLPALAWLVALGHLLLLKVMRELDEGVRRIFSWTTLGLVLIIGMLLIRVILLVT